MAPRFRGSELTPRRPPGPFIQRVEQGAFIVEGKSAPAWLLTPESALPWHPPALAELAIGDFEPLLALSPAPEFLLLGTGERMAFAPRALVEALGERGIGVEAMDSRAAARTWAVLRAEERWIAAAIMPI